LPCAPPGVTTTHLCVPPRVSRVCSACAANTPRRSRACAS
jgi:hypothetical protein